MAVLAQSHALSCMRHVPSAHVFAEGRDIDGREASGEAHRAQPCLHEAEPSFYMCACAFGTCIRRGARHRRTLQHDVLQCPESASGLRGVGGGGKRGPGFATQNGFTQILLKNLD